MRVLKGNEEIREKMIFNKKVKVADGRIVVSEKTAVKMYLAAAFLGVLAILNVCLFY